MPAGGWTGLSLSRGAGLGMSSGAWQHVGEAMGSMCRGTQNTTGAPTMKGQGTLEQMSPQYALEGSGQQSPWEYCWPS